jgi:hypothetical protein
MAKRLNHWLVCFPILITPFQRIPLHNKWSCGRFVMMLERVTSRSARKSDTSWPGFAGRLRAKKGHGADGLCGSTPPQAHCSVVWDKCSTYLQRVI